jgi:hypothetical protein
MISSASAAAGKRQSGTSRLGRTLFSFLLGGGLAIAALAAAFAQDQPQKNPGTAAAAADPELRFVVERRLELKRMHDTILVLVRKELPHEGLVRARMVEKVHQLAAAAGKQAPRDPELNFADGTLGDQQVRWRSAVSQYENAKLTREVAEIAVIEYEHGIFAQDKGVAVGTLATARSFWERAKDRIREAQERLDRLKKVSTGSTADISIEVNFADQLAAADRQAESDAAKMREAESALNVLTEYTKPKRMKELEAEVAKAKVDELLKQAAAQVEEAKLKKNEVTATGGRALSQDNRVLALLDQALPIEQDLRARLDRFAKTGKPDPVRRKEIDELVGRLRELLVRATMESDAAESARLKDRVRSALSAGSTPKTK